MKPLEEPQPDEAVTEAYGSGWIQQSWLWACDDCLHESIADDDTEGVGASCGSCDSAHEAREALMQHNVTRHGGRAFS